MPVDSVRASGLSGLEALLKEQRDERFPPVERWNPPYRGDIGMKIASDGTWFYQGSPISRKSLVKLFSRVLRKDEDGKHYLVTPVEKIDIEVVDAPFLAVEMDVTAGPEGPTLIFRTNVDDVVQCGRGNPLRFVEAAGGGLKPYLLVRGRLEALVTRALYYDLVEMASVRESDDGEELGLTSAGIFFPMAPASVLDHAH